MTLKEVLVRAVTSRCKDLCILTWPCPSCQERIDEVWRVIGPIETQIIELRDRAKAMRQDHQQNLAAGRVAQVPALSLPDLELVLFSNPAEQTPTPQGDNTT